ncbi:histone deacetylase domain-containing protein [Boletus edulis]|nr:histone deacetylase domain-containing protein [Boletus edulis]
MGTPMLRGIVAPEAASDTDSPSPSQSPTGNVHAKRTAIFIQDECLKHRFIRSRDDSGIFERPERLHAVKLGLAAAISRIEDAEFAINRARKPERASATGADEGDLAAALARMAIAPNEGPAASSPSFPLRTTSVTIRRTSASVSLLDHAAVKYVHGDIDANVYLENLIAWARNSQKNITEKGTEIPKGIPPLDLYLCPGSIDAIQGAIGAVCEAIDASVTATRGPQSRSSGPSDPCARAFVAIRPPGHHCGEDTPCGFCFINNVAVGAAHAHLNHGMQRIVILDIDLHHGNGTQSIVWQVNEETYQQTLESDSSKTAAKPGPRIFYGSLHDILSFPCEDGKPELVQAASTSIHGPHGQYIENIHLQRYDSEAQFWDVLYPQYLNLLHRARDFLDDGPGDDAIIFISCGFDAGEHEYPSMSRHHRKVPVGFYHQFTREACKLADQYAHGRIVSVLEGGYSDRALMSGAMAHLFGLVDLPGHQGMSDSDRWVDDAWWSEANLVKLEKAAKPRKSASARANMDDWLARTLNLLPVLNGGGADSNIKPSSSRGASVGVNTDTLAPQASMTLRERKKPMLDNTRAGSSLPETVRTRKNGGRSVSKPEKRSVERTGTGIASRVFSTSGSVQEASPSGEMDAREEVLPSGTEKKKLPRVILHVRSPEPAG